MYQYYSVVLSIVHVLLVTNFVGTLLHCIFVVFLPVRYSLASTADKIPRRRAVCTVPSYSASDQNGTRSRDPWGSLRSFLTPRVLLEQS